MLCKKVKNNTISFKRALTTREMREYQAVLKKAKEILKTNGESVLIVHSPCLPQSEALDTGVGTLSSKRSSEFLEFMKKYLGITAVETLPTGELKGTRKNANPYSASAFSIGEQEINLELLTQKKFKKILSKKEFDEVVEAADKGRYTDISNVAGEFSKQRNALKKAWERFKRLSPKDEFSIEFLKFKEKTDIILTPKALFKALEKENGTEDWLGAWSELDKQLMMSDSRATTSRIKFLQQKYAQDIEFYKFRQFLAHKSLEDGKRSVNSKGLKLIGDCLIGFSPDEIWANQKAFNLGTSIGWGLPAIDYSNIFNKDGSLSVAGKLLERKFEFFLSKYDGVRFDVAWSYIKPHFHGAEMHGTKYDMSDSILKLIEQTAKRVKGEDFDLKNLLYEVEAGVGVFSPFDYSSFFPKQIKPLEGRVKIFTTAYMSNKFGSNKFLSGAELKAEEYILGVGNHDTTPLKVLAKSPDMLTRRKEQIDVLSPYLRIPKEFLDNPVEFAKAKFAEAACSKNQMQFYMDVFGREETFNNEGFCGFANRIEDNFETSYHKSLQTGYGLNPMDAIKKAFIAKGKDKSERELFDKISEFAKILSEKGCLEEKMANRLVDNAKFRRIMPKGLKSALLGVALLGVLSAFLATKIYKKNHVKILGTAGKLSDGEKQVFDNFIKTSLKKNL